MNPDPDIAKVKRVLDLAAVFAWVLLGVAGLGLLAYLTFSGMYGTGWGARVPIILGFLGVLLSAVMQVIFTNSAVRAFPMERNLRVKALVGIVAPGVLAFIGAAILSLIIQVVTGDRDPIGSSFLFGCTVLVCAPLAGFLFDAGRKLSIVERKYGAAGAVQLYQYQLAATTAQR